MNLVALSRLPNLCKTHSISIKAAICFVLCAVCRWQQSKRNGKPISLYLRTKFTSIKLMSELFSRGEFCHFVALEGWKCSEQQLFLPSADVKQMNGINQEEKLSFSSFSSATILLLNVEVRKFRERSSRLMIKAIQKKFSSNTFCRSLQSLFPWIDNERVVPPRKGTARGDIVSK